MKIMPALLGALALVLGCSGGRGGEEEEAEGPAPPAAVTCEPARTSTLGHEVAFRGTVSALPDRQASVASTIAGRVASVAVHEGQRVRRGAPIARIDDPTLGSAVTEGTAGVAAAQADAEAAAAALARAQRLAADGLVAEREVESARARSLAAQAALVAARARSGLAVAQRSRAALVSPIDGTVLRVLRRAGELVDGTPATPIVEIADPSVLELASDVPAQALVRLTEGSAATLTADALPGESFQGHVSAVAPAVDPSTSLGTVRVRIEEPGHLRIGLAGRAVVRVGTPRQVVVVPRSALRRSAEGTDEVIVCTRTDAQTRAHARAVVVGAASGSDVEVARGLRAGEQVVTDHVLGLADGTFLHVRHAATRAAGTP